MALSKVYLFGTCLIDTFYPTAGLDAIALLELCNIEVAYPPEQTCCGQPPYNSGAPQAAAAIAEHTIERFSRHAYPVIVPSASCAGMIKNHYPQLFDEGTDLHQQALVLASRTYELMDFIVDKLPYSRLSDQTACTVALHISCSAQRETQSANNWETVLSRLPNVTIETPRYAHECCGFGGMFAIKASAISSVMTEDKARFLLETQPDIVCSGDYGCLMNLEGLMRKQTIETPCLPLASFVAKRFGVHHDH